MSLVPRPLVGLKVLDLSRVLAGPVCCQLLADLGADVVKVEQPGRGDDTRHWGPPFVSDHGTSAYFLSANRGKRSLALDLALPAGREVLFDLLRVADVMVENFLPATLKKLGLEPDRLAQLNGRLVSCAISGYGRTGPWADRPGYDLAIQASSGLMSITGPVHGPPSKVGVAMTDVLSGLYAAASVLAGLYARDRGSAAMAFDLALADCTLASLVNVAQATLLTGQPPTRHGNAHPQIVPYEVFATADGHLALAIGNDQQWQRFCTALGQAALADDERFRTNPLRVLHRQRLVHCLTECLVREPTATWVARLTDARVPHAVVRGLDEALADDQSTARQMVETVADAAGRRYRLLGSPVHWQGEPERHPEAPPALGQHSDEILANWLGYDAGRIGKLRAASAIA